MPVLLQASMRSVPAGTVSFLPSTVRVTSAMEPLFALRLSRVAVSSQPSVTTKKPCHPERSICALCECGVEGSLLLQPSRSRSNRHSKRKLLFAIKLSLDMKLSSRARTSVRVEGPACRPAQLLIRGLAKSEQRRAKSDLPESRRANPGLPRLPC